MKKFYTYVLVALLLVGCAVLPISGTSTKQLVDGYSKTGNALYQVYINLKSDCDTQILDMVTCGKLKVSYNQARLSYVAAGDALDAYLKADTPEGQTKAQTAYNNALVQVTQFITTVQEQLKKK